MNNSIITLVICLIALIVILVLACIYVVPLVELYIKNKHELDLEQLNIDWDEIKIELLKENGIKLSDLSILDDVNVDSKVEEIGKSLRHLITDENTHLRKEILNEISAIKFFVKEELQRLTDRVEKLELVTLDGFPKDVKTDLELENENEVEELLDLEDTDPLKNNDYNQEYTFEDGF